MLPVIAVVFMPQFNIKLKLMLTRAPDSRDAKAEQNLPVFSASKHCHPSRMLNSELWPAVPVPFFDSDCLESICFESRGNLAEYASNSFAGFDAGTVGE